jgi:hypothetical protein
MKKVVFLERRRMRLFHATFSVRRPSRALANAPGSMFQALATPRKCRHGSKRRRPPRLRPISELQEREEEDSEDDQ